VQLRGAGPHSAVHDVDLDFTHSDRGREGNRLADDRRRSAIDRANSSWGSKGMISMSSTPASKAASFVFRSPCCVNPMTGGCVALHATCCMICPTVVIHVKDHVRRPFRDCCGNLGRDHGPAGGVPACMEGRLRELVSQGAFEHDEDADWSSREPHGLPPFTDTTPARGHAPERSEACAGWWILASNTCASILDSHVHPRTRQVRHARQAITCRCPDRPHELVEIVRLLHNPDVPESIELGWVAAHPRPVVKMTLATASSARSSCRSVSLSSTLRDAAHEFVTITA